MTEHTTRNSTRGLITAMIIIGIIIIVLLISPRLTAPQYSYQTRGFLTASSTPIVNGYTRIQTPPPIVRTYGHPITRYTTTTYSQPQYQYYSYTVPGEETSYTYYPDGCTAYTAYSATTGQPCN